MNRHNSHQQPEATANDANADQWQIDVSEQGASKVDSYGNASDVNGGRNANDINHTSDQGETVKVQVIKDNQDEPNDRSSLVEQGSQASQTVWASAEDPQYSTNNVDPGGGGRTVQTGTETQPKKRGIIELLGSSPLGVMAQTALDSVRQLRAKKQEYKQAWLIRRILNMPSSAVDHSKQEALEQQRKHAQLNQLVEDGELDLSNKRVLQTYMDKMRTRTVISDETTESDSKFISKMLREGKINLSDLEMAKEFLDTRGNYHNKYFGIREALELGKLDLSNEDIKRHFLDSLADVKADSVALLDASGLPIEEIAANEHIRQVIVDETSKRVCLIETNSYDNDELSSADKAGDSYRFGVIDAICATDEGKQCLTDSINKASECESIQDVGEKIENNILWGINPRNERSRSSPYDKLIHNSALIQNVAKYNSVLRKLGWEPLKKDESLAKLFYTYVDYGIQEEERAKRRIDLQDRACRLGLITPEVTDRLYDRQFNVLFREARNGFTWILDSYGGDAFLSGHVVSPDLAPSGNDLTANYWREQSSYLGNNAMRLCMAQAYGMTFANWTFKLSDLIDKKGILKDAFFQNRPGSFLRDVYNAQETYDSCDGEEYARTVRFLEAHKDQTRKADGSRALVNLLGKMKNENGGYDMKAIIDLQRLTGLTYNYKKLFDANGLKPKVWQNVFSQGGHLAILRYYQNQDEAGKKRMGLDDKQIAVARGYSSISEGNGWNNPRRIFESYVKDYYDELTIDQIGWVADITARLASSNASELAERSEAFTSELLKLDADKIPEALDKIEDIYIHNHLPYVGKNYLVFRTMHPSDNLENDFHFDNGRISPVLQQATGDLKSGKLDQMLNSRDAIIISDLLRASLGSNNRSIREYLATLKNGQTLLDQLSSGELDWNTFNQPTNLMDKDTKANYDTLSTFAWHLATIYNSTLPGKEHPYQLIHQQVDQDVNNALQTDFTNLTSLIKPNSRYTLADRAVRYFAHFVGIEDLAGAERYMDDAVKEADARNRRMAEYLVTTNEPKLQPGDLVKGMGGTDGYGIRYLSYAFQNGSISKEYLGDASRSDTTPLDADASIVLHGEQTINQTMDSMIAGGYGGGLWTVLRPDKDRFIITRRDKSEADRSVYDLSVPDANFDRTNLTQEEIDRRLREIAEAKRHRREGLPKLEIFATGVDGDGHYGIRTGFGMDKVSYYISDRTTRTGKDLSGFNRGNGDEYTLVSEVTKLEIALNGFYIPIIDRDSEELIFTPADYDKMREQMSGLSYYRTGDYQFAPDSELELGELTLDKESLSAVSAPTTSSTNSSSSSTSDDAQGASSSSITIPSTTTIISELPTSIAETDHKHEVINQTIKQAITNIPELNLSYKDYLDGDLTENIVEMIDTGSTGRQTNAPGSGDFDYMARLDRSILNDPTKKQQITDALLTAFGRENDGSAIVNGNLRLKQVSIDGLAEPVDIDITFAQKTNKVQYPTDAALADRLDNIKNQSETKYQQVLANIIYAKQFLKAAGAYKPRRSPEARGIGGLGGVGIENWVLQHGGSFKQAARDFLAVADSCSSFEDFCAHYPVWDYGENHKGIRSKPHDNFVADNMNQEGYERMKQALRAVVG